jgi:hypothetical protein
MRYFREPTDFQFDRALKHHLRQVPIDARNYAEFTVTHGREKGSLVQSLFRGWNAEREAGFEIQKLASHYGVVGAILPSTTRTRF